MKATTKQNKESKIITYLQQLGQQNFTGSLLIQKDGKNHCQLYFRLGRLIWLSGHSNHFQKQLHQYIDLFLPNLSNKEKIFSLKGHKDFYESLAQLYYRVGQIEKENITNLLRNIIVENIFDLIQFETNNILLYKISINNKLSGVVNLFDTNSVCQQAILKWCRWEQSKLSDYSPNLFPVIENLSLVQKTLNPLIYSQLISLVDGTKNLRLLARIINLDLITLTQTLLPVIQEGGISLKSFPFLKKIPICSSQSRVSNISEANKFFLTKSISSQTRNKKESLICCIDDSPRIIQELAASVSKLSYQFIGIQHPLKAIPLILKNSPDLIFLDLMMPAMSGYELCDRLRKIPTFQNIPIVILTADDRSINKVKAKLVGATDFLSKPISSKAVIEVLNKYLFLTSKSQV